MDILELKREYNQFKNQIDAIRGSLWLRWQKSKNCHFREKDIRGWILEW